MRGTMKRMTTNRMESLKRPEWQSGAIPKPASEWLQPGQVGRRTWPRQSWQTGWPGPAWSKEFSCQLFNKIVCKFATPRIYHLLGHQWTWESVAYWKPNPGKDGQPACWQTHVHLTWGSTHHCSREIFNLGCYGRPVKDHGVVATDAEEKEYHSKGGERDPEGSII